MIGLSAGLEIARKALSTYQLAISVYGNNIANVDTPGFSRRRPRLGESEAVELSLGRIGLGVSTATIRRMRDVFLDRSYRNANASYGRFQAMEQTLSEVEMAFAEPSDTSLGSILQEFWDSWQELANEPESSTAREMVIGKANSLCDAFRRINTNLVQVRQNIDDEVARQVDVINSLASRIAALNKQIVRAECSGNEASDLRDKRDELLDELSEIVDIRTFESADGTVSVKIGTEALVERGNTVLLRVSERADRDMVVHDIVLGNGDHAIRLTGGKLAGLIESRDVTIPEYLDRLNYMARTLVEKINELHRLGYGLDGTTGIDFFDPDGITAATISVAHDIVNDSRLIAASTDGTPGNADNALAIAGLRLEAIFGSEGATAEEYYSAIVGDVGIESSRAAAQREAQELLVNEIENRRESVKGVSLDEEMTNLVASQHAYQAAAKLVSVIDNLMGVVMELL